ncbi:unnamed protein product [Diamesa serratosioi]
MNTECIICILKVSEGERNAHAAPCGHIFHHYCIVTWIGKHSNCPCCRKKLSTCDLVKLNWEKEDVEEDSEFSFHRNIQLTTYIKDLKMELRSKDIDLIEFEKKMRGMTDRMNDTTERNKELMRRKAVLTREYASMDDMRKQIEVKDNDSIRKDNLIEELIDQVRLLKENAEFSGEVGRGAGGRGGGGGGNLRYTTNRIISKRWP